LWAVGGITGRVFLTPGRRYVAVRHGGAVRFLYIKTGLALGDLATPLDDGFTLAAAAFARDGGELAALLARPDQRLIARWDLRTGESRGHFPTSADGPMSYAGNDRLLVGDSLVDLERESVVHRYADGAALPGGPGKLRWRVGTPAGKAGLWLLARAAAGSEP
jgi:hypothetical protein